jgi:hypothetical protein
MGTHYSQWNLWISCSANIFLVLTIQPIGNILVVVFAHMSCISNISGSSQRSVRSFQLLWTQKLNQMEGTLIKKIRKNMIEKKLLQRFLFYNRATALFTKYRQISINRSYLSLYSPIHIIFHLPTKIFYQISMNHISPSFHTNIYSRSQQTIKTSWIHTC